MFNMTRNDLRSKTTPQLAALFNEVSSDLANLEKPSGRRRAQSLLVMIRAELSARRPHP